MDINKFTEKAREAVTQAQSIAVGMGHQDIDSEHLALALIRQEQGIVPRQILELSNMDLLIDFAKIGLGVSAVIREFVLKELHDGTLIELPLPVPVRKREAGFAYLETNRNEALASFLRSIR